MKSKPVALLLADLGITKTHSRPHVSDDNPFSESQFKTLKYRPEFPIASAPSRTRRFCQEFFPWYNDQHHHSGIALLTPAVVHFGEAQEVIQQRQQVLDHAYARDPKRFVRACPKHQPPPTAAWINPPRSYPLALAMGGNESSDDRAQNALKIPARQGGIFAPKENVAPPFPANPRPPLLKPASQESRH